MGGIGKAPLLLAVALGILLECSLGGASSARRLLHEGRGVNICSKNEERPRMRNDCKSDPVCVHESQCGCIPKGCSCGNEKCIYTHEEGKNYESEAVDLDGGGGKGKEKAHTHIIGDKQAFKFKHSHHGGKAHEHEGGDRKHHHTDDGGMVYDDEDGEEMSHHHHHKKGKAKSRKAEAERGAGKRKGSPDGGSGGGGKASGASALSKVPRWAWISVGVVTLVCICSSVAIRGWCRKRGKSMLSKDMFNDSKEMQAFDWDSKVAAAGWASDDL